MSFQDLLHSTGRSQKDQYLGDQNNSFDPMNAHVHKVSNVAKDFLETFYEEKKNYLHQYQLSKVYPGLSEEAILVLKKDCTGKNFDSISHLPGRYQGASSIRTLHSFVQDLSVYSDYVRKEGKTNRATMISQLCALMERALHFDSQVELINQLIDPTNKEKLWSGHVQAVKEELMLLRPGERFVMSGSTHDHGFLYEFVCREEGKKRVYDFKLINSGDGLEYHKSKKSKYQSLIVETIDASVVENEPFLQALIYSRRLDQKCKIPILKWIINFFRDLFAMSRVYNTVKKYLIIEGQGKKVVKDDEPYLWHKPQKQGTCVRKRLHFWLKENLEKQDYLNFKVQLTLRSLETLQNIAAIEDQRNHKETTEEQTYRSPNYLACLWMSTINKMSTQAMIGLTNKILQKRIRKSSEIRPLA